MIHPNPGGVRALATTSHDEWAHEVVPTPELVPPTPAKESTLQSSSRYRFSPRRPSAGALVDRFWHLVLWLAQLLEREGGSRGSSGACWAGLAVLVAVALGTEAVLVQDVWPWLMHHDLHVAPAAALMTALPPRVAVRFWWRWLGELVAFVGWLVLMAAERIGIPAVIALVAIHVLGLPVDLWSVAVAVVAVVVAFIAAVAGLVLAVIVVPALPPLLSSWWRRLGEAIEMTIDFCRWAAEHPKVQFQLAIAAGCLLLTLAIAAFSAVATLTALGRPVDPAVVAGGAVLLSGVLLVAAGIDQWRRGR